MRSVPSKIGALPAEVQLTQTIWTKEPVNGRIDSWKKFVSSHFNESSMNSDHGVIGSLGAQPTWKQSFPGKKHKISPPPQTDSEQKPIARKFGERILPNTPTVAKNPANIIERAANLSRGQMCPGKVRIPEFAARKIEKFRLGPPGRICYPEFLISHAARNPDEAGKF